MAGRRYPTGEMQRDRIEVVFAGADSATLCSRLHYGAWQRQTAESWVTVSMGPL